VSVDSVFYVNRNSNNRKRHVDLDCRYLQLAREALTEMHAEGWYDDYEEREGEPPPTEETRFVKVVPRDEEELQALEAFILPCVLCIPGARDLWGKCPVDFE
jgi:hypothetical protein